MTEASDLPQRVPGATLSRPPDMSQEDQTTWWQLKANWEHNYNFSRLRGKFLAGRTGTGGKYPLQADSPGQLEAIVREDFRTWQRETRAASDE
jgi:hypothetical protein